MGKGLTKFALILDICVWRALKFSRIKSAGATLRRYGEQALQNEVHALLKQWHGDLVAAQCVYLRASQRERRVSEWLKILYLDSSVSLCCRSP